MIVVGVVILIVVLFVLLIIPTSQKDILGTWGADSLNFGAASPTVAPTPDVTELQAQDLQVGTGSATVKQGDTITVHYTGYLMDSSVFDSSIQRNEPFVVTIGAGQVIPGFEQGVIGMKIGGKRRIFIPSDLAYGAQGQGAIPPNSDIAFDVELLDIKAPEELSPEPDEESTESLDENSDENNNEEPTPEP